MANWYKKSQNIEDDEFMGQPPRMARYRTMIVVEVRVPENPDKKAELQLARAKADELLQEIQGVVGDAAIGLDSSATKLGPGLLSTDYQW